MRLIDVDAMMEDIENSIDEMTNVGIMVDRDWLWAKLHDAIENAPTIKPERKKGKWIDMGDFEECSVCGCTQLKKFQSYYGKTLWVKSKFCPGCGAELIAGTVGRRIG